MWTKSTHKSQHTLFQAMGHSNKAETSMGQLYCCISVHSLGFLHLWISSLRPLTLLGATNCWKLQSSVKDTYINFAPHTPHSYKIGMHLPWKWNIPTYTSTIHWILFYIIVHFYVAIFPLSFETVLYFYSIYLSSTKDIPILMSTWQGLFFYYLWNLKYDWTVNYRRKAHWQHFTQVIMELL